MKSHWKVIFRLTVLVTAIFITGLGGMDAWALPFDSINSTSDNSTTPPLTSVGEPAFVFSTQFQTFAANDLGMHCGDLDHRVASILPPFNVVHAQVVWKGATPVILTGTHTEIFYAAASNPQDPVAHVLPAPTVFKTNFWDLNPQGTGNTLAFDGYNPFYPPGILPLFPLVVDTGLPVPDTERLYLGDGQLVADQHSMPGLTSPYAVNTPQRFLRFNTNLPFFINFPFGYTLNSVRWFAAEGVPIAPFDDRGRKNNYPLMRAESRAAQGNSLGLPSGTPLASIDTVVPVSAEAECYRCHTSSRDGGNGEAACLPGVDPGCTVQGSLRSGVAFNVATADGDTPSNPLEVRREWAADLNIIRLHDAKFGTNHQNNTPVVCQRCHYSPALDLAHVGPLGPGDAAANGREQRIHQTNSRVLHTFHGWMGDLFPNDMPPPNDPRRLDPGTGKPVINTFVQDKLDQSCYQCHPGRNTKCLRGAMFNGGLICHDCHGGMLQVGNDFSINFSTSNPFPKGADLTRRIPWANEPGCQSCHTGDALTNLGLTDPNVIRSTDGIRLLRAYRTTDQSTAKPIVAQDRRFAENQTADGRQILYRLSKGHGGIFCQACHGSTHAEWPVHPESGTMIANDNMAALQLQGHTGKIIECNTCHGSTPPPLSLNGPHGLHPVNDQRWVDGHEDFLEGQSLDSCRRCHGAGGEGTVLSKTPVTRSLATEQGTVNLAAGTFVGCSHCHKNPLSTKSSPTPNPMTWATPPYQTGTNSISMVATTATDPSSPINYYFDFVGSPTGGLGGADSGWQAGTSYTNSNLRANHKYGYRVKAKDGVNNQTAYSTTQYAYTAIQAPIGITFGTVTATSIQVRSTNTPTGLSWGKSGLWIENTVDPTNNSGWKRDNTLWTSKSLKANTSYSFQAKARNGDGIETGYGPPASNYTRASLPGKAPFSDVTRTSIRANWTDNGNPPGTQYFCQNVTTKTDSGWITDTFWNSDNLACGVSYSFRVKAKNEEGIETGWTSLGSQSSVKCVLLLKPNGGEAIASGSNYNIQWEATPEAVSFDIFYSLDSGVSWLLTKKDERNTIYSWTVPKTTGNKKACLIRVVGYNAARTKKIGSDASDKPFTIEVVRLTSPNGGPPSLKQNDNINITWTANETTQPITKIQLSYTKDGGTTYNSIITLSGAYPPGDYIQPWTIPAVGTTPKTKCKVKVVLKDQKGVIRGSDVSDGFFTIEP